MNRQYLATLPVPDRRLNRRLSSEPNISSLVDVVRQLGYRISDIERKLEDITTNGRSPRLRDPGDPPCIVCGLWSEDVLCPTHRVLYPWMRRP